MASLNSCQFIGRVGRDPEVRYTPSGQIVANFSLAVDETYKDKDGQKVEKTEWIPCTIWGKQAEFVANYIGKGRLVHVAGKWQTRKWTDKDGNEKYSTECVVNSVQGLDRKPEGQQQAAPQREYTGRQEFAGGASSGLDDAPFMRFEAY